MITSKTVKIKTKCNKNTHTQQVVQLEIQLCTKVRIGDGLMIGTLQLTAMKIVVGVNVMAKMITPVFQTVIGPQLN